MLVFPPSDPGTEFDRLIVLPAIFLHSVRRRLLPNDSCSYPLHTVLSYAHTISFSLSLSVMLLFENIFFYNRVVNIWNELPSDTDFTCINSFKRRLTSFNLNIYCDHD